jgi:predicted dehydrogenase
LYTLGEINTAQSLLANQFPKVEIIDGWETKKVVGTAGKDTPDQIHLQATLKTGAILSFQIQGGPPPPFDPKFLWRIYGEKGNIAVDAESLMLNVRDVIKIRLHDVESDTIEVIEVAKNELDNLPQQAKNIGRLYEAYAKEDKDFLVTFEEAFQRHVLIEKMLEHWDNGNQGWQM